MSAALTDWLMTRNAQLEMQAERQHERLAAASARSAGSGRA